MNELALLRRDLEAAMAEIYPDAVIVHGEGKISPAIMLIGEAPGEQETIARRPFVGKAGKNLDAFLEMARIDRDELYVSNVVKMRPWKLSASGNKVNRPPTRKEIGSFLPWLTKEIALVAPKMIVTLGNVPLGALAGNDLTIGAVHGQVLKTDIGDIYPMYHPASVIYNRSLEPVYCEDVRRLGMIIRGEV